MGSEEDEIFFALIRIALMGLRDGERNPKRGIQEEE